MWLAAVVGLVMGALMLRVHLGGKRRPRFPDRPVTVVVLGALVFPDGTPSSALADRVRVAVSVVQSGRARLLLLSGGSPDSRPTEAATMARLAKSLGVQEHQLALETESRSTFQNAARSAEWLRARGETEIILVSCDFHLARATAHFRMRGLKVWPVPSLRSLSAGNRFLVTVKELAALLRRPWLIARL